MTRLLRVSDASLSLSLLLSTPLLIAFLSPRFALALDNYYTNLRSGSNSTFGQPLVKPEPTSDDEDALNWNGKRERTQSYASAPLPTGVNPFSAGYREPESEPKRIRIEEASPAVEEESGGATGGGGRTVLGESRLASMSVLFSFESPTKRLCGSAPIAVDGVLMNFDDVTEDDQERMTPDEYTVRRVSPSPPSSLPSSS